jgi:hypothetical protein
MRKLKLIWDFRGPNSAKTAEHHLIHLKEYLKLKELNNISPLGTEKINDMHHMAFLVCPESEMIGIRDALKPHRGQLYQD